MTVTKETKTYYEIKGERLNRYSRLRLFNILLDHDGATRFFNIFRAYVYNQRVLFDSSFYDTYEVQGNDWWDNIAYKFYGDAKLWWMIAELNEVINPFEELEEGQNLKILKPEYLYIFLRDVERVAEY